jgi:putative oxidoreductase
MTRLLGQYSEYIYAIMRIVLGFLFVTHGTQGLFGLPPMPANMPHMELSPGMIAFLTTGAVVQLVCGLLIFVGLFASVAAFIASGEMAVAYFVFHQPQGALPASNGGDAAVLFCFIFLYIAARGSGIWSVDALRGKPTTQ